jgi:arylsulfatase A-like enzyme
LDAGGSGRVPRFRDPRGWLFDLRESARSLSRMWARRISALTLLACALPAPACQNVVAPAAPRAPNVILIVADDLGRGDLGCYGQARIRTPALDALAQQGLRFTQAYASAPVCAPSRCALLTGMHTGHSAIRDNKELQPEGQQPLPAGSLTLAELLHARGYTSAAIGKWGLGTAGSEGDPLCHGFDHFFGLYCQRQAQNHYPSWIYRDGARIPLAGNRGQRSPTATYAPDLMREEALAFLREQAHQSAVHPFFLYYAMTLPHAALQVPVESLREYASTFPETPYDGSQGGLPHPTPRAAYAAMVTRLDHDVGLLLAELERLGLAQDTLVIFTSDNGPTNVGGVDPAFFDSAGGARGLKWQLYEGGIRTPLIVRWPGHTRPASVADEPCAGWDLMPTIAQACGARVPEGLDGLDLGALFAGGPAPAREFFYWENPDSGGWQAVRMGDWKALRRNTQKNIPNAIELYDLAQDPGETRDVAARNPEIVERARRAFATRTDSTIPEWNIKPAR